MNKRKCQYPGCENKVAGTWALVPLCKGCLKDVQKETATYYKGELSRDERDHFLTIAPLSPVHNHGRTH